MVLLGSAFRAAWVVIARSWQQTAASYHIVTTEVQGGLMKMPEFGLAR